MRILMRIELGGGCGAEQPRDHQTALARRVRAGERLRLSSQASEERQDGDRAPSKEGFASGHGARHRPSGWMDLNGNIMLAYYAIVHKDADSAFGLAFPDLPGIFSAADNEDEIVEKAMEALQLWAEDEVLPPPSTLEMLREREDVREALAEGAFVVRVPVVENDARVVRANVTFEAGLLRAIDETSKKRGISRAAFLAGAARKALEA